MMEAWKLGGYEFGRYGTKCVKANARRLIVHSCKLRELEDAAVKAAAEAAEAAAAAATASSANAV
jgi:hypothetical protein